MTARARLLSWTAWSACPGRHPPCPGELTSLLCSARRFSCDARTLFTSNCTGYATNSRGNCRWGDLPCDKI